MATTNNRELYKDIDVSLTNNIKDDFSIISGMRNCVFNNITNVLQISSKETPFDNTLKPSIDDVIHSTDKMIFNLQLKDAIEYAALQDDRIDTINDISVVEQSEGYVVVKLSVKLIDGKDVGNTEFNLKITKK